MAFTQTELEAAAQVTGHVRELFSQVVPLPLGTVVTAELAHGRVCDVTAGVRDAAAEHAFQFGQCHAVAIALSLRTGYPIVFTGPDECEYDQDCNAYPESWGWCGCQVEHVGVLTPDGQLLDIVGMSSLEDLTCDDGRAGLAQLADMHFVGWVLSHHSWRAPDVALALSFVDQILRDAGLAPAE